MKYRLIINPFAELDLKAAFEWYELQKEGLGHEFINGIDYSIERIQNNPKQFPFVKKKARMAVMNRFPFGIYFMIKGNVINVFAIFHFKRNPSIWKGRT